MNRAELLLPDGARLLHVGPYKTGTTGLQASMFAAREQLLKHGVASPGPWRRAMREGWAVLGWAPRAREVPPIEEWTRLVREVESAGDQRVWISTEDFGKARPEQAARIVEDLGGDRVHVIAVARSFDRLLPSAWQERIKGYDERTLDQWLHDVLDDTPGNPAYQAFWASHDVERLMNSWGSAAGDRFSLVVTDMSDRNFMLRTVEAMLGLPDGLLNEEEQFNPSLTMNACELVRRVNVQFSEQQWPDTTYHHLIQRGAIRRAMYAPRPHDESIPPLPRWALERIEDLSEKRIATIQATGARVIGDLESLRTPVPDSASAAAIATPGTISMDQAEAAVSGAVEGALRVQALLHSEHERQLRQVRRKFHKRPADLPDGQSRHAGQGEPGGPPKGEGRRVRDVTSRELLSVVRHRLAARLLRRFRRS
jgi:hypothetical protein